jgi:hypothetical protein
MAVRIFALALVVAQVMARGKSIVNRHFKHESLDGTRHAGGAVIIAEYLL